LTAEGLYTTPEIESRDNLLFRTFSLFYTCKDNQRMLSIRAIIVRQALSSAGKKSASCPLRLPAHHKAAPNALFKAREWRTRDSR
jgi:hypothetical protein